MVTRTCSVQSALQHACRVHGRVLFLVHVQHVARTDNLCFMSCCASSSMLGRRKAGRGGPSGGSRGAAVSSGR
eukprot:6410887-Prymnesium_polylepis.1